jgi:hypothetical protein
VATIRNQFDEHDCEMPLLETLRGSQYGFRAGRSLSGDTCSPAGVFSLESGSVLRTPCGDELAAKSFRCAMLTCSLILTLF